MKQNKDVPLDKTPTSILSHSSEVASIGSRLGKSPATSIESKKRYSSNEITTSRKSICTPPRTPRISELKSQVLKPTFLS